MPTIKVRVSGKIAENLTPEVKIVCGNEDYKVEFEFDEPWESANVKTGLFIYNGKLVPQPFDGAVCPMPIIENTTLLAIGVKTSDGELYTTTPAYADCLKSASDLATNKIPAPSKDVYDEIIALINKYIGQGGGSGGIDFGETEGTAYEGNKGKANADNIEKFGNELAVINVALEQSGLLKKYKQPIEQEYNERVTANGLNVLDGSTAILKKVVGNTVACKNLFDKNLALDGYEIINANEGTLGVNTEWFTTNYIPVRPNTSYVVSGKPDGSTVMAYNSNKEVITNLGGGISGFRTTENVAFVRLNGLLIQKDTFQLEEGTTATEYQPYFTGLKSASFAGIESTNADGTETSTLEFPKTETPLGVTIDFENKKITEEYEQYTFTGDETVTAYGAYGSAGYYLYLLGHKGVIMKWGTAQDGVCDKFPTDKSWWKYPLSECIRFGQTNSAMYLILSRDLTVAEVQALIAGMTVRYPVAEPTETDFTAEQSASGNEYTAWVNGTEKVLENDGNEYGADNTLTQDYILVTEVK